MASVANPQIRFLTIVTFGRSGSTALQSALNAHPHTIIRGENYSALRGLQGYVQAVAAAGDRHRAGRPNHPWFGTAKLDPRAVLADQRRHVVEYLLRPKADTRWVGFKEVRYEEGHFATADELGSHLLFLNTLLPGMRYLINTRDPRAVAESGWWREHADAVGALERSSDNLHEAADLLTWTLGEGRVSVINHDEWKDDASVVVAALEQVGYPVDTALVNQTLSQHLRHGQRS